MEHLLRRCVIPNSQRPAPTRDGRPFSAPALRHAWLRPDGEMGGEHSSPEHCARPPVPLQRRTVPYTVDRPRSKPTSILVVKKGSSTRGLFSCPFRCAVGHGETDLCVVLPGEHAVGMLKPASHQILHPLPETTGYAGSESAGLCEDH